MNGWTVAHGGRIFPETFRLTRTAAVEAFLETAPLDNWKTYHASGFRVIQARLTEGWE